MKWLFFLLSTINVSAIAQSLLINEVMTENTWFAADDGLVYPWIEFVNDSSQPVSLSDYFLSNDSTNLSKWTLPAVTIPPDSIFLIWLSGTGKSGHSSFSFEKESAYLILTDGINISDRVPLRGMIQNQSYGRRSGFANEFVYFIPSNHITPSRANPDPGPWVKVQSEAAFEIGDSGSFGCLVFDGKMWILDYETLTEGGEWEVLVQVWNSSDGFHWTLVNRSPPYRHQAMFTVFDGFIWAFDGRAFRSRDGKVWEKVSDNTPHGQRVAAFKGSLWILDEQLLYRSEDGKNWSSVIAHVPWHPRSWPAFMVHNDKLWMFGGVINYNTGDDVYFTDVWSSDNGLDWELVNQQAPWRGTIWFTYASFDGKIWMIDGGWNYADRLNPYNGNGNEVWYSSDGITWQKSTAPTNWFQRHAQFTWVFKDELWIGAGYAGGGRHHIYNDIWKYSRRPLQVDLDPTLTLTYGDSRKVPGIKDASLTPPNSDLFFLKGDTIIATQTGEVLLDVEFPSDDFHTGIHTVVNLSVQPKILVVKPKNIRVPFGAPLPEPTLKFEGFAFDDSIEVIDELPRIVGYPATTDRVVSYKLSVEGGSDDNYALVRKSGTLEIYAPGRGHLLFPNPVVDELRIIPVTPENGEITVECFNNTGARLIHVFGDGRTGVILDVSQLPPGLYIIRITSENGPTSRRIVKL